MKLYEYMVEGSGSFPFDMLRRDSAWPADTESAISLSINASEGEDFTELRRVVLHSHVEPTVDRWKSFQWNVTAVMVMR